MSGDAGRSPEGDQAAGAVAGPGPARTPGASTADGWRGWDADQAVAALYHAHYRSLTRVAALLAGDDAAADEIAQDAFVCVHRAWRHLRHEDAALDHLRLNDYLRLGMSALQPRADPERSRDA